MNKGKYLTSIAVSLFLVAAAMAQETYIHGKTANYR